MKYRLIKKNIAVGENLELPKEFKIVHVEHGRTSFWIWILIPISEKEGE